jgi:hypothetical protein
VASGGENEVKYGENGEPMVYDRGLGKWVLVGAAAMVCMVYDRGLGKWVLVGAAAMVCMVYDRGLGKWVLVGAAAMVCMAHTRVGICRQRSKSMVVTWKLRLKRANAQNENLTRVLLEYAGFK